MVLTSPILLTASPRRSSSPTNGFSLARARSISETFKLASQAAGDGPVGEDDVFLILLAPPPDDEDGRNSLGGRGDSELGRSKVIMSTHNSKT